jgi:3-hydroxy-3-methylglutaryl CoA synthase
MPEVNWQNGGIVRWAACLTRYRLSTKLISKEWVGSGTTQKSDARIDEDPTTIGIEAARRALVGFDREIDCGFFGSGSRPYAVKASAITVAESLGARQFVSTIDLESDCRGVIEGLFRDCDEVTSGKFKQALVVASDVANSAIADPLERTASAAAVAMAVGTIGEAVFSVSKPISYATDTIDFHRRDGICVRGMAEDSPVSRPTCTKHLPLLQCWIKPVLDPSTISLPYFIRQTRSFGGSPHKPKFVSVGVRSDSAS